MRIRLPFVIAVLVIALLSFTPMHAQSTGEATAKTDIIELVADMEAAVLAGDDELYLTYVDLSDPVFAVEHRNWARDWSEGDYLTHFEMSVSQIEPAGDEQTRAQLMLRYGDESVSQQAAYTALFRYDDESDRWRYAGEYWLMTEIEHFVIHTAPGQQAAADALTSRLPYIYDDVTTGYDYIPDDVMSIKIYATGAALSATTLLSLPIISGWNEPNESLKAVTANPEFLDLVVRHEMTHFLTFEQAGGQQPQMPWWLAEGIAEYIAESTLGGAQFACFAAVMSTQDDLRDGRLVAWEQLADFEETPLELWSFSYTQGCAFVRYMTDTFGAETRNTWLHAMATDSFDDATESVLALSFDELDAMFREWLLDF